MEINNGTRLLARLRQISETEVDPESQHWDADHALLEFVGNKVTPKLAQLIEEAYNDIEKWYG
jgi:hypothetical protein